MSALTGALTAQTNLGSAGQVMRCRATLSLSRDKVTIKLLLFGTTGEMVSLFARQVAEWDTLAMLRDITARGR